MAGASLWRCGSCHFLNLPELRRCDACDHRSPHPDASSASFSHPPPVDVRALLHTVASCAHAACDAIAALRGLPLPLGDRTCTQAACDTIAALRGLPLPLGDRTCAQAACDAIAAFEGPPVPVGKRTRTHGEELPDATPPPSDHPTGSSGKRAMLAAPSSQLTPTTSQQQRATRAGEIEPLVTCSGRGAHSASAAHVDGSRRVLQLLSSDVPNQFSSEAHAAAEAHEATAEAAVEAQAPAQAPAEAQAAAQAAAQATAEATAEGTAEAEAAAEAAARATAEAPVEAQAAAEAALRTSSHSERLPPTRKSALLELQAEGSSGARLEGPSSDGAWLSLTYDPKKQVLKHQESGKPTKVCGKVQPSEWDLLRRSETLAEWHKHVCALLRRAKTERRLWIC